ncbi:MAG: multidrug efflux SMR transporter [Candidatus Methanoplasma sp.]|jgi:quaternary ammonium compound-resistance protein SugE|nr:multidrug efflux SMR transporter [Candidatus Methanoplasma sp.]
MKQTGNLNGWTAILLGGLFQIIWAIGLDYTNGFTDILWDATVVAFVFLSIWCLSYSMGSDIPVSTAYTVWIGLGVVGTVIVSFLIGLEPIDWKIAAFLTVIVGGVAGLKMTPAEKRPDSSENGDG